ncbi:hypothetical protein [Mycobacterium sp. MS1601]|uniref:hypothetical protein n=1 Tax=Mycobacterium sp. MS1601 TaxID=1936029 RepID=UPI0012FBB4A6|nr:hypothetical protein [Mycobacterium sp. MS1601]
MRAGVGSVAVTGVAIVSVGVIAATPIEPPLPDKVEPAVQLAADSDWSVIFNNAGQNAGSLVNSAFNPAFPILQQSIANQIRYLGELPDIAGIAEQIAINVARGFTAPGSPSTDTLDGQHTFLYNALPFITSIPGVDLFFQISPTGQMLLDFSASPLSGVLLGLAGPIAGPLAVMGMNFQSIIEDLTAANPDAARALSTFVNTPAQMVDAFLNGDVHVDITALAEAFGPAIGVSFPEGTKVGITFGGLFSPGGSIFNALDMDYERDILGLPLIRFNLATGNGPGFIGSLIEMNKIIAKAIGWDGSGNPLDTSDQQRNRSTLAAVDEIPDSGAQLVSLDAPAATAEAEVTPVVEADVVLDEDAGEADDVKPAKNQWNPGQDLVDGLRSAVDDFGKIMTNGFAKSAKKVSADKDETDSDAGDSKTDDAADEKESAKKDAAEKKVDRKDAAEKKSDTSGKADKSDSSSSDKSDAAA